MVRERRETQGKREATLVKRLNKNAPAHLVREGCKTKGTLEATSAKRSGTPHPKKMLIKKTAKERSAKDVKLECSRIPHLQIKLN